MWPVAILMRCSIRKCNADCPSIFFNVRVNRDHVSAYYYWTVDAHANIHSALAGWKTKYKLDRPHLFFDNRLLYYANTFGAS